MEERQLLDDPQIAAVKNALQDAGTPLHKSIRIRVELEELGVENVTTVIVDDDGTHADITFLVPITVRFGL